MLGPLLFIIYIDDLEEDIMLTLSKAIVNGSGQVNELCSQVGYAMTEIFSNCMTKQFQMTLKL